MTRHDGVAHAHQGTGLQDYLRILRRRRWIVLLAVVLVPLAAVLFSLRQDKLYESTAQVLLSNQDISTGITGVNSSTVFQTPDRVAQTQAELAMTPPVARMTVKATGVDSLTPAGVLSSVSVVPEENADILDVSITNRSPALAQRLATQYARQFTIYKERVDTAAVRKALDGLDARLADLEASGDKGSGLYDSLRQRQQELQTIEALQTRSAVVVRDAAGAAQVQPKPVRNGIIGLMLGIVLGLGLAFLRDALDTRVRTAEEVMERLGLSLLARLPSPPKRLAGRDGLVMLEEPRSPEAEAFRMLRTNFEFVNLEREAHVVMVTSAVESEGKSTTAANLALALARAGRHVTLVDLDLRRPYIDRFFNLRGRPGLTQVALGRADLAEAVSTIALSEDGNRPHPAEALPGSNGTNGHKHLAGVLDVLGSGPIPPDPGEFVGTRAVAAIIETLRERSDIVVVDAPPLLRVGDAMELTSVVDGIVLVARLKLLRRPLLRELHRLLSTARARTLGLVVTGAEAEDGYGYGYGYEPGAVPTVDAPPVREPVP